MTDITPKQKAYALLWRSMSPDQYVQRARKELLSSMTKDEQRDAIGWLVGEVEPVSDAEILACDISAGIFPRRSYGPTPKVE